MDISMRRCQAKDCTWSGLAENDLGKFRRDREIPGSNRGLTLFPLIILWIILLVFTLPIMASSAESCSITGDWNWQDKSGVTHVYENGKMEYQGNDGQKFTGKWILEDAAKGIYVFSWKENGAIDKLSLSTDCNTLDGTNNFNMHVTGKRIVDMTPSKKSCSIIGDWDWQDKSGITHIYDNGKMEYVGKDGQKFTGTWVLEDTSKGLYVFSWNENGAIDRLTISADCNTLDGTNNFGGHVTATRSTGAKPTPTIGTSQPGCVWSIWGVGLQVGSSFGHANKNDVYNLRRALTYALDNCKVCCCRPEPLQDLLNRVNGGENSQSIQNGITPLLDHRNQLVQDCSCHPVNGNSNINEMGYIYGMAVQLGSSHAWAYHKDRETLKKALEYSIINCQASKCCKSEPLQDILNRLNNGENIESLFFNGVNLLIENPKSLGLDDCTCGSSAPSGSGYPEVINECEKDPSNKYCGTFTLKGDHYEAEWDNSAKAKMKIEKWDKDGVILNREDTGGLDAGLLTARYTGQISGNSIINGQVTWTSPGWTRSGTWTATW